MPANLLCEWTTVSADGRFVAFLSFATNLVPGDTNGVRDVFVRDRFLGTTGLVSVPNGGGLANGGSDQPTISSDGHFVLFQSSASNWVLGDTNGYPDLFLRDLVNGVTERVNISSQGAQANDQDTSSGAISADGRYVAWHSSATNLVPLLVNVPETA